MQITCAIWAKLQCASMHINLDINLELERNLGSIDVDTGPWPGCAVKNSMGWRQGRGGLIHYTSDLVISWLDWMTEKATKLLTKCLSRPEEKCGPVLWRVPWWQLQWSQRSGQCTCPGPEIRSSPGWIHHWFGQESSSALHRSPSSVWKKVGIKSNVKNSVPCKCFKNCYQVSDPVSADSSREGDKGESCHLSDLSHGLEMEKALNHKCFST